MGKEEEVLSALVEVVGEDAEVDELAASFVGSDLATLPAEDLVDQVAEAVSVSDETEVEVDGGDVEYMDPIELLEALYASGNLEELIASGDVEVVEGQP